jgi:hypothetical protein
MTDVELEIDKVVVDADVGAAGDELAAAIQRHVARAIGERGLPHAGAVRVDRLIVEVPAGEAGGAAELVARTLVSRLGGGR